MPCFRYFWPCDRALRAGRDDEGRLATATAARGRRGDDHVHVGDAAVGDPRLGAVERPLVLRLVVDGAGAQARHVGAGVGFGHAERAELHVVGGAVALRHPLHDLLGSAVAGDAGRRERRAHDRHADAGVTPEDLLDGDRKGQAGRVAHGVQEEVGAVEPDLCSLLHDRPWELLTLVPLVGGRTDDSLGEVVDPLLDLDLIFGEIEREIGHGLKLPTGNPVVHSP